MIQTTSIAAAGWWFAPRLIEMDPLLTESADWNDIFVISAAAQAGVLVGCVVLACLCVYLVRGQRSGEQRTAFRWRDAVEKGDVPLFVNLAPFTSPRRAQIWFELRRAGGRAMVIVAVALGVMVSATFLSTVFESKDFVGTVWALTLVFVPLGLVVASNESLLGIKYLGHSSDFSVYEGTRPVTVGSAVLLKLAISGGITLVGWLAVGLVGLVCVSLFSQDFWEEAYLLLEKRSDLSAAAIALWSFAALVGFATIAVCCATAALLTMSLGYAVPRMEEHTGKTNALIVLFCVPIVAPYLSSFVGWDLTWVSQLGILLWGVFLVVAAVISLWQCVRERYYHPRPLTVTILAWVELIGVVYLLAIEFHVDILDTNIYGYVLIAGFLCIPPASLAWAPLSLAALRNR